MAIYYMIVDGRFRQVNGGGPFFVNRVWDTESGSSGAFVTWITSSPDTTGVYYPGPGVFGVNTSGYCLVNNTKGSNT